MGDQKRGRRGSPLDETIYVMTRIFFSLFQLQRINLKIGACQTSFDDIWVLMGGVYRAWM